MKRRCVIIGLVGLLSSGVWAIDYRGVGNWSDPNNWSAGRLASGAEEVKVRGSETVCTLSTGTGDWGAGQRLRVYEGATLVIQDGGELLGAGWMRAGSGDTGSIQQTGGLVQLQNGKDSATLGIGDSSGSNGSYTISGGTLTYTGEGGTLLVGARGGNGKLTIIGAAPVILMNTMTVADRAGAVGILEFQLAAEGVGPVTLLGGASIDPLGDETRADLIIQADTGTAKSDVLLIDLPDDVFAEGSFDTVNGEPAEEGATVVVKNQVGDIYTYTLTYLGGEAGNDVMLLFSSYEAEPVDPGLENLTHLYTFEDGTADDGAGDANGVLVGGATVVDGSLVISAQDQWMEMSGEAIALNTYEAATLAICYTSVANANTGYTMLAYFGDSVNGLGANGIFLATARGDNKSRAAISIGDVSTPWASESGADGPEYDDGLMHYMASTIDAKTLRLYIDGEWVSSTALSETNQLGGLSTRFAYLAKGGYSSDPEWIGSIQEFSIYNKVLSLGEIRYLKGDRPAETPDDETGDGAPQQGE